MGESIEDEILFNHKSRELSIPGPKRPSRNVSRNVIGTSALRPAG